MGNTKKLWEKQFGDVPSVPFDNSVCGFFEELNDQIVEEDEHRANQLIAQVLRRKAKPNPTPYDFDAVKLHSIYIRNKYLASYF